MQTPLGDFMLLEQNETGDDAVAGVVRAAAAREERDGEVWGPMLGRAPARYGAHL